MFLVLFFPLAFSVSLALRWLDFPPRFLAQRFEFFRLRRLLGYMRAYQSCHDGDCPSYEWLRSFFERIGEEYLLLLPCGGNAGRIGGEDNV